MNSFKKANRKKSLTLSQDILQKVLRSRKVQEKVEETQKIFKYIDDNVIGKGVLFFGPYGRRKGESSREAINYFK